MKDLIEALQIFLKYKDSQWPTHCEHDVLSIMDIGIRQVSEEDVKRLDELGFMWDESDEVFISFKFGSA